MGWKGTAEDRQRWAIKKRLEREAAARQTGSKPLPGYEVAADDHHCGERDVEYADHSGSPCRSVCRVCGRTWTYTRKRATWAVEVIPLSDKMPVPTPGTGSCADDLPPEDVRGAARGKWWIDRWTSLHPV